MLATVPTPPTPIAPPAPWPPLPPLTPAEPAPPSAPCAVLLAREQYETLSVEPANEETTLSLSAKMAPPLSDGVPLPMSLPHWLLVKVLVEMAAWLPPHTPMAPPSIARFPVKEL